MQSFQPNIPEMQSPAAKFPLKNSSEWLISVLTVPFIGGLWGSHSLGQFLQGLGSDFEEVFRGDRLPLLPFPDSSPQNEESSPSE